MPPDHDAALDEMTISAWMGVAGERQVEPPEPRPGWHPVLVAAIGEAFEKAVVTLVESKRPVMDVIIFGDTDERSLKVLADNVRDDLMAMPSITYAEVKGTRPYEISIEVSEEALRAHGLSLPQVAEAVRLGRPV